MAIGDLVGNLAVPGFPGAIFTLASNPGGFFAISGSNLVEAINTPTGTYNLSLTATNVGITTPQPFILFFTDQAALLVDGTDDALLVDDVNPALTVGGD